MQMKYLKNCYAFDYSRNDTAGKREEEEGGSASVAWNYHNGVAPQLLYRSAISSERLCHGVPGELNNECISNK